MSYIYPAYKAKHAYIWHYTRPTLPYSVDVIGGPIHRKYWKAKRARIENEYQASADKRRRDAAIAKFMLDPEEARKLFCYEAAPIPKKSLWQKLTSWCSQLLNDAFPS
jgi:hypothetical protein